MSDDAAGWQAIDRAVGERYGDQVPRHVGYPPGVAFGSGLQGCSAYAAGDHWHYVSYGLTELFAKEDGSDPDVSGWGYELTMRVASVGDGEAPGWPFGLLEAIAGKAREARQANWVGDRIDVGGPITFGEPPSALTALVFVADPQLGSVASPNGRFDFRQVVGVTAEELAAMRAATNDVVLDRLRVANPLLVTDPARRS